MWRVVLETAVPFLIPFALYAIWVGVSRRGTGATGTAGAAEPGPRARVHPWVWLSVAGLLLAFGVLVLSSRLDRMDAGARYAPATLQDGRIVPGGAR
jgi:hypothetical protein